jgi:tRNA nucleotidyltransferase/poly(A) polymerase
VRQSVQFGLRIDPETLHDVREVAARLKDISVERVRDELFRMLSLPKPGAALRVANSAGLLNVIFPDLQTLEPRQWEHTLFTIDRLVEIFVTISPARTDETVAQFSLGMLVVALDQFRSQLNAHLQTHWANERSHRALMILGTLLAALGSEVMECYATALHLSSAEKDRLVSLARHANDFPSLDELTPTRIYRFWKQTRAAGVDVILFGLAQYLGISGVNLDQDDWLRQVGRAQTLLDAYYVRREQLVEPPSLVNGDDLIQRLGVMRGRKIGELLEMIREAQVNGEVVSAEDALNFARTHLNNHHKS